MRWSAFKVTNDGLDGLAAFEQLPFFFCDALALAPVHDVNAWIVGIHPTVTQVHKGRGRLAASVLHQDGLLLQLGVEGVAVVGVAVEGTGPHDQVAPQHAGNVLP